MNNPEAVRSSTTLVFQADIGFLRSNCSAPENQICNLRQAASVANRLPALVAVMKSGNNTLICIIQ